MKTEQGLGSLLLGDTCSPASYHTERFNAESFKETLLATLPEMGPSSSMERLVVAASSVHVGRVPDIPDAVCAFLSTLPIPPSEPKRKQAAVLLGEAVELLQDESYFERIKVVNGSRFLLLDALLDKNDPRVSFRTIGIKMIGQQPYPMLDIVKTHALFQGKPKYRELDGASEFGSHVHLFMRSHDPRDIANAGKAFREVIRKIRKYDYNLADRSILDLSVFVDPTTAASQ